MLMKYLSEYHPSRIRSASSLKTEGGSLRLSKVLMAGLYGLLLNSLFAAMRSDTAAIFDANLYRRGHRITAASRWICLGIGLLTLALLWSSPGVAPVPALATAVVYGAFNLASALGLRRLVADRPLRITHDVVDALAVGLGAYFTGGMRSPVWLLLYLHSVGVAVRGGLAYAMIVGLLDAAIVATLSLRTPETLGPLHALALLWLAFLGGTTSSYLRQLSARVVKANVELRTKNAALHESIAAQETSLASQQQAMARLRASEERYRRLLERLQDGVVIVREGRVAYANHVFAQMLGARVEDLAGASFLDLVPQEDRKDLWDRYLRWEASQAVSGVLESRVRTRDGETRLVSLRASSVDFEGRRSIITTVRDITREREMERELQEHAERLATINEIANAVNLSLTVEDIFRVTANEARRLVPCDRITLALVSEDDPGVEVVAVGTGDERRRAAFTRDEVAWAFRRPMAWCHGGEEPPPHLVQGLMAVPGVLALATVPLLSKDRVIGSLALGRFRADAFAASDLAVMEPVARHIALALDNARLFEAVRRRGGEIESLLGIVRGIIDRLDLSEILPLVTRSLNGLMGTHLCALLLREGDELRLAAHEGLEPEVVRAFERLRIGESLSGWVALHGRPLSVPDMKKDGRSRFADLCERYGYRSYLCVPLKRGGEVIGTLEVVTREVRRFRNEEQELMAAFADQAAVAIDNARLLEEARSSLARTEEANVRLEALDTLRRQYLRNVSHEFRTPLTVIKGYAEYLLSSPMPGESSLREVMRILDESCDRLIDLVDTLIEVSRIEQGAEILNVAEVDLRELAHSSLQALRGMAIKRNVALDLDLPDEALTLEGDGGLLQQVVRKLVDNAVKYSLPGGRVVVRARCDGEGLDLEVADSGVGIAAEHLPRIFEKFYTADGGLARRLGGSGVGLYLVKEIVRLHNGTIAVSSELGRGSLFAVRLPREFRAAPRETTVA
jgi:PAS domain S-box-containing protein